MGGTTTTRWAVCVQRAYYTFTGATYNEAMSGAMEYHGQRLDADDEPWPATVTIEVYRGAVWCTGPDEDGDCYCGIGHEVGPWMMIEWAVRHVLDEFPTAGWAPQQ